MLLRGSLIVSLILISSASVNAQSPTKAYVCTFDDGLTSTLNSPYNPGTSAEKNTDKMEFTFAVMDQEKGRALIIGNNGAANVSFNRGSNTTTFFEHTPAGNWNVTVIIDEVKGVTRAITSRHIVDPTGFAIISQWTGTCVTKS